MTVRQITAEEAALADALRYLRAFPTSPIAQQHADKLLKGYSVEACNEAYDAARSASPPRTNGQVPGKP